MQLDNEDRNYLDKHFEKVHGRITDNKVEIAGLGTSFNNHVDNPCPNIVKHWRAEGKIIVGLIAALGLIFAIFQYFYG